MTDALDAGTRSQGRPPFTNARSQASLADRMLPLAIWLAVGGQVWSSILGTHTIALIGTYNFTVAEVSLAAGGLAVATGWLRYGIRRDLTTLVVAAFAVLAAFNLIRGLVETPASALVMARATVPFPILLILCTVPYPRGSLSRPLFDALSAAALTLTLIVFARIAFGPQFLMLGGASLNIMDINDGGRALPAGGALLLATAVVVNFARALRGKPTAGRHGALAILLFTGLLLTGQGTATIAGLIGVLIVAALERGPLLALRLVVSTAVVALGGSLLLIAGSFSPADFQGVLPSEIINNLERREANLGTRELVWQAAWNAYLQAPTLTKVLGWPTGASPDILLQTRSWGWVTWTASVHSMYLGTLLATGAAGAALYIGVLLLAVKASISEFTRSNSAFALAVVVMLMVFGYTYSLPAEQALVMAIALMSGWVRAGPKLEHR